jgi:hypothetical protein
VLCFQTAQLSDTDRQLNEARTVISDLNGDLASTSENLSKQQVCLCLSFAVTVASFASVLGGFSLRRPTQNALRTALEVNRGLEQQVAALENSCSQLQTEMGSLRSSVQVGCDAS